MTCCVFIAVAAFVRRTVLYLLNSISRTRNCVKLCVHIAENATFDSSCENTVCTGVHIAENATFDSSCENTVCTDTETVNVNDIILNYICRIDQL